MQQRQDASEDPRWTQPAQDGRRDEPREIRDGEKEQDERRRRAPSHLTERERAERFPIG